MTDPMSIKAAAEALAHEPAKQIYARSGRGVMVAVVAGEEPHGGTTTVRTATALIAGSPNEVEAMVFNALTSASTYLAAQLPDCACTLCAERLARMQEAVAIIGSGRADHGRPGDGGLH